VHRREESTSADLDIGDLQQKLWAQQKTTSAFCPAIALDENPQHQQASSFHLTPTLKFSTIASLSMKLSSSTQAIAAGVGFLLRFAEAVRVHRSQVENTCQALTRIQQKSAASDIFDWHYELDAMALVITTKSEMYATADAFNQTVSIELVEGTMMLVDQMSKKQVATFSGALNEWARAAYPSPSLIANMKQSGELAGT